MQLLERNLSDGKVQPVLYLFCSKFLNEAVRADVQGSMFENVVKLVISVCLYLNYDQFHFKILPFFYLKCVELVLKVRVQNPKESDFIEIELDRQELTYQDLLRVSCCELGVNPEQVEKIRKLPNTLVRKVRRNILFKIA